MRRLAGSVIPQASRKAERAPPAHALTRERFMIGGVDGNIDRAIDHIERAIGNLERFVESLRRIGGHGWLAAVATAWILRLERQSGILRQQRTALAGGDTRRSRELFLEYVGVPHDSTARD